MTVSASVNAPAGAGTWPVYHNDRYGATIDYPDFFKAQPPPDNDDDRKFKSADSADFTVSAIYALDFDLAKYRDFILENLDPGAVVTYQATGLSFPEPKAPPSFMSGTCWPTAGK